MRASTTMTEITIHADAISAPCPRCRTTFVLAPAGRTVVCGACEAGEDEFDREARVLLTDNGERSWFDVERAVADALRARALR